MMTDIDIDDMRLQSLMSLILPHEGESIALYIGHTAKALGHSTDSKLAATIGVTSATIANWKRRNSIPNDYIAWLSTTLIEKIVTYGLNYPRTDTEARTGFLRLIVETNGNPYQLDGKGEEAAAISIGGLLSLSQFLLERMYSTCEDESEVTIQKLVENLRTSMFFARNADQLRAFR